MPSPGTGVYGAVEDQARNRVNLNDVLARRPDMLNVAGSLFANQVRARELLRMPGRENRPIPLGRLPPYTHGRQLTRSRNLFDQETA
ncbi:hypothetical protein [Streptomyces sp. NPDC056921]|uniref:hypothetical protein n=1 Tax=Streptomyces sp. NPDC056921 TaxID=3345966 RepID=UPI00363F898B